MHQGMEIFQFLGETHMSPDYFDIGIPGQDGIPYLKIKKFILKIIKL